MTAVLLVMLVLLAAMPAVAAQPDAGSILREFEQKPPVMPESRPAGKPLEMPPDTDKAGLKIKVAGFDFEGLTLFPADELRRELAVLIGKELSLKQLEVAPQTIISYYRSRGRIASAFIPRQEVKDGRLLIRIVEGSLGTVTIDPKSTSRLRPELALGYLLRGNSPGGKIDMEALEAALRLLKGLPGVTASSTLLPGKARETSDLLLTLGDAPLISGSLEVDNHGSRSSGETRGAMSLNLNNYFGYGDQLSLRGQTSFKNNYGRLSGSIPVGVDGSRLAMAVSYLQYDLDNELDAMGDAFVANLNYSFPTIHYRKLNLSGQSGYEYRRLNNKSLGAAVSDKRLNVVTAGLNIDSSDYLLGGGFNSFSIGFGGGYYDPSAVSADKQLDNAGPRSSGFFGKIPFSMSRTQTIKENSSTFSLSVSGQFALKNLDSSEQFSAGGVYGVRAYPTNEGSGDTVVIVSAELRQMLHQTLQAGLFYDVGWLRQHTDLWGDWRTGSSAPNEYSLDGAGLSLTWTPAGWCMLKGIVASRLRSNPGADEHGKDQDGTKKEPRFWLQALVTF
jgi:hemolysin activation/secretion protein